MLKHLKNRPISRLALIATYCLAAIGCTKQVEFPRTGTSMTIGDGTIYFIQWKNGPAIMICTDIKGGNSNWRSSNDSSPLTSKENAQLSSPDGRNFEWQMETTDGRTIKCRLGGKEYDLAKGTLFLVKTKSGKTEIEQHIRDFLSVQPNAESCEAFARKDAEVGKLLFPEGK